MLTDAATSAEDELVEPLFQFRNYGLPLAHNRTTQSNRALFGIDYCTRTAVAKSNILVNKPIVYNLRILLALLVWLLGLDSNQQPSG